MSKPLGTLTERLRHWVNTDPDKVALRLRVDGGGYQSISYADLYGRCAAIATTLAEEGIAPGDRVALLADNGPDWILGYLAIHFRGAVVIPLDSQYGPSELSQLLSFAEPAAVVADAARLDRVRPVLDDLPGEIPLFRLDGDDDGALVNASASDADHDPYTHAPDDVMSIIFTSGACGVTGLRPTYGRVSRYGAMALSWTMDKIGPLCRSVEDCALVFNAIYGSDGRDGTVVDAPFAWDAEFSASRLRVGYIASEFADLPGDQQTLLQEALQTLRRSGVDLEPVELPDFPADALRLILDAESAAAFDELTRSRGVDDLTQQGSSAWPNSFRSSRFVPAVEYIRAQRARTLLVREMRDFMDRYDIFLSPTRSRSLTMTNLTGNPALALKAGFAEGLPVALMVTGRLYDEATVLQLAAVYQNATPWHTMNPTGFGGD